MSKNINHLQHVKSNVVENGLPKLPLTSAIVEGEIAVNYADGYETFSIKNSNDEIVRFSSDDYYTTQKLGSGFTGENSAKTVTSVIEENEEIVSSAINDLELRKLDASEIDNYQFWTSGTGENAVILKNSSGTASGDFSVAEGRQTSALTPFSHAEGQTTKANGFASHAEGGGTVAFGMVSHAEGAGTLASGPYSHAEGYQTTATSESSHAEGYQTTASGSSSHAEGYYTKASGWYSHAEGYQTTATSESSHAEGNGTTASGSSSHAEGVSTTASGLHSHSEGNYTTASGLDSHAEGRSTIASGDYGSHAEGTETLASGISSHAEGEFTKANGNYSHAEGMTTSAMSTASHAEGGFTKASGPYSHAEGHYTTAMSESSHAEGEHTIANNFSEHASGQYNVSSSASTTFGDSGNTLFSVGNGTSDSDRKNAFEIRQNGDIYIIRSGSTVLLQDEIGNIVIDQVIDSGTSASTNAVSTKAVYDKIVEDEEVWALSYNQLNADKTDVSAFTEHTSDTTMHMTATEKENLDSLAANIDAISGITSAKVDSWDAASTNSHTHSNKTALDSITGNVGTMAYENVSSYSSATEVNTALSGKSDTGHTHDDRYYTETEIDNKIAAMSGSTTGAASKTITAMSETNGVVTPTYADISITKSQISDFAHNQASNTITAMTDYAMAASGSAITTADTLNQAIGKLEKMIDEFKTYVEQKELAIAAALTDLDDRLTAIETIVNNS